MSGASRDLARLARWRHPGFRRRRLPYLVEQFVTFPLRQLTFPLRHPGLWLFARAVRRAAKVGETVIEA